MEMQALFYCVHSLLVGHSGSTNRKRLAFAWKEFLESVYGKEGRVPDWELYIGSNSRYSGGTMRKS